MSWKSVCAIGDVDAQALKKFDVDGVPILVVNLGDEHRCYPPVCPHMEEPLEDSGLCQNGTLTCTKHLWQWDMRTGDPQGEAERPLLMYETKTENGQVMVFIENELEYDFDDDDY